MAVVLLAVTVAAPASAENTLRGPDAHVLPRPRGDVLTDLRTTARTVYIAPYPGWTYTRLRVGQRLRPGFRRPAYVITPTDLPPAGANRRWIRYGGDRVLIDISDGRVLRVIGNVPLRSPR